VTNVTGSRVTRSMVGAVAASLVACATTTTKAPEDGTTPGQPSVDGTSQPTFGDGDSETTPCGSFSFMGTGINSQRGVSVNVSFNFNPASCSSVCTSRANAYAQVVRIIDRDTGGFVAPNSEQADRIVTGRPNANMNGWAIDRIAGRRWGHFGRNNDGTFAATVTVGSNTASAILVDNTAVVPNHTWFESVSVPVSIDAESACVNGLLGFEHWWFTFDDDGTEVVTGPNWSIGLRWHRGAFDEAVAEWNADTAGLGKTLFPPMTHLEP